jgi:alginate O-acetyltransferase complex protein AlgI
MLLGGLWHGASWNFVIWGGYHGALLGLERVFGRKHFQDPPHGLLYPFRALITFALVCVGWVFFRAATFHDSMYVIEQMFSWHGKARLIPVWLTCMLALSLVISLFEEKTEWIESLAHGPAWAYVAAVVTLLFSVELVGVTEKAVPFVYFQF